MVRASPRRCETGCSGRPTHEPDRLGRPDAGLARHLPGDDDVPVDARVVPVELDRELVAVALPGVAAARSISARAELRLRALDELAHLERAVSVVDVLPHGALVRRRVEDPVLADLHAPHPGGDAGIPTRGLFRRDLALPGAHRGVRGSVVVVAAARRRGGEDPRHQEQPPAPSHAHLSSSST
jgi:hypothetical protein